MKNAGVNDVGGVSPALVSICVCTYRRPHVLARLLDRLTEVEREAEGLAEIAIVIVDDDIARSAESVRPHTASPADFATTARPRATSPSHGTLPSISAPRPATGWR